MRVILIISVLLALFAFFATEKMLPNWVHNLCSRGYDKHAHCAMFFVLQVFCSLVMKDYTPLSIAAVLVVIGGVIEIFQPFSSRSCDILDFFSNCAGILFALIFFHIFNYFR